MHASFYIIIIAVVIVVAVFLFSDKETEITNHPSQGETIIAFGDSLVEGVGASSGNDFISLLSSRLNTPIKNLGRSGDTTETALRRLDESLGKNPQIVIVLLGGNDYLRKIPKETTFKNLKEIIRKIQNKGAITLLLGIQGGVLRDGYKDEFMALAKEYGTAYVPNVLEGLIGRGEFMYDTIHPNDKGHEIIALKIYPVLHPLIRQH